LNATGSVGYQYKIPNSSWFVEPSAGVIWSRTRVDPFNVTGPSSEDGLLLPGTLKINDINSTIGRLGLRVGTTISSGNILWQPFAAVSVWHEFGPNITSNFQTCANCFTFGAGDTTIAGASNLTTFGTYGQYSVGSTAQIANTGWLGFARIDYRNGSNLQGLSGTGGIRYQFTPDVMAFAPTPMAFAPTPTRLVRKPPKYTSVASSYNWTGFYLGGFAGADGGNGRIGFDPNGTVNPRVAGFLGGGQVGYNYQMGTWLLGVEGDGGWTNARGSKACAPLSASSLGVSAPLFNMTCNAQANWIATTTGRFGYILEDRYLFYVKGGAAWIQESFSATCNFGQLVNQACTNTTGQAAPFNGSTSSDTRVGWTVGFGVEFGLTSNWSAKAEYDFAGFDRHNLPVSDGGVVSVGMNVSQVKIGLNYRFN
jgi:opacity protein-like surface antigen